ncbi:Uu.00g117220.m01.CDS01 [Anthostomella pinea]|uniref:Uu.00g117220.m01.CDS01 n=1 Tax=Anthostomella pinea TaxID=933095 RepID=A0AAI8VG27_9PEZI|nr:Uu.00g117220.m01.CDS01 [Anthostomella pinea]
MNQAAAGAAQRMPQLVIMELWDIRKHRLCIFRYDRREARPGILLLSNFEAKFSAQSERRWREVADGHDSRRYLECTEAPIPYPPGGLATGFQYLCLARRMIDDSSRMQITNEYARDFRIWLHTLQPPLQP